MPSRFDFHFGVLYGLAAATNPDLARMAATKAENEHDDEIKALAADLEALRAQLAALPTPDDMRLLAVGLHNVTALPYGDWDRYEAIKRGIVERWAPAPAPEAVSATTTEPEHTEPADAGQEKA